MTAAVLPNPGHFRHRNPFNDICQASGLINYPSKAFVFPAPRDMDEKPFSDIICRRPDHITCFVLWMLIDVLLLDNGKPLKHNNAGFFTVSNFLA
jgi:hypothetical protein